MRLRHFEALAPVCPVCRTRGQEAALVLRLVERERNEDVLSGLLGCDACGMDYPILDGLPVIVADVRRFVQDNLFYLMAREDLSPTLVSVLADAAGPGSGVEAIRQPVSSYGWDHWGDKDPEEVPSDLGRPGQVARVLRDALSAMPDEWPDGPLLDIGCGAGRSTAELAERTGRMVLGIDLSVSLARVARRAVVEGHVSYDRRRIGLVYDRRSFAVAEVPGADIWICDALALPFPADRFAGLVGLNVLDCLGDPRAGLAEFGRVLRPGGSACLATPFDWSPAATPVENWLGGHSARGSHRGAGEPILDMLLGDGPWGSGALRRRGPSREVDWHVRLHERSLMRYRSHMVWSLKPLDAV